MVMHLMIIGPPGAGKGTTSKLIEDEFGLVHIAMGDILRQHVIDNDDLGRQIAPIINKGNFVPDQMTFEIMARRLAKDDVKEHGYILDGYPRTVAQAQHLLEITNISGVIIVRLSDEAIIKRMSNRRICPKCGRTYHLVTNKPQQEGVCDLDGEKLILRADDNPETVKKRLEIFYEKTNPVVKFFEEHHTPHIDIPGDFDIATEAGDILKKIREWQAAVLPQ